LKDAAEDGRFFCAGIPLLAERSLLQHAVAGWMLSYSIAELFSRYFSRVQKHFMLANGARLFKEPVFFVETKKQYVFMLLSGIINYTG
jgi:hypothetical protein